MTDDSSWKYFYSVRKSAAREGEEIAKTYGFTQPPVDPFSIMSAERDLIHAEGYDFQSAFDGRIKYVGPRFLICYNTRYNQWPHSAKHHSKIIFTVAHELGHFFLPRHREYLVKSRNPHGSFTEFTADPLVEQEADFFASGLLMPDFLLRPIVNQNNFISLSEFHEVRRAFHVSLTGMLVRWTQLSDFPCATIAIKQGRILFGWVSEALSNRGAFRLKRNERVIGKDIKSFVNNDPRISKYREGSGSGSLLNWIDYDKTRLLTEEFYFAIPHTGTIWAHVIADENDL
tara:strand:- start:2219 stop:3079 length:861 start_codon:yes stop_codon:yes gene_type:complete